MASDFISSLRTVARFLEGEVVDGAPSHLRSEIRAAAKLLSDAAAEADLLPGLIEAEIGEMQMLEEEALSALEDSALSQTEVPDSASNRFLLSERIDIHIALRKTAERTLAAIQNRLRRTDLSGEARARLEALALRYYRHFANQAEIRIPLQSVFSSDT